MKQKIAIFAFCLMAFNAFAQYNGSTAFYLNFLHQPSARAEALGKGYSSIGGDIFSSYYNPAGLGKVNGLEFNGNYAKPFLILDKANFSFIGLGYNINKYIQCGFSRFHYSWGDEISFTDLNGNVIATSKPYSTNYALTASSNPIKNLYLGININFLQYKFLDDDPYKSWTFDFGVLETIPLFKNKENLNALQIGASIKNFTFSKMKFDGKYFKSELQELPVIARIGANYKFGSKRNSRFEDLRVIQALALIEYQDLLNYKYLSAYRFGCEATIFEILALRCGYYIETIDDYDISGNRGTNKDFTYGVGIIVPLEKLTNRGFPLTIKIDYTNLPQPADGDSSFEVDNLNSFGLSVNYRFGAREVEEGGQ